MAEVSGLLYFSRWFIKFVDTRHYRYHVEQILEMDVTSRDEW